MVQSNEANDSGSFSPTGDDAAEFPAYFADDDELLLANSLNRSQILNNSVNFNNNANINNVSKNHLVDSTLISLNSNILIFSLRKSDY